MVSIILSHPQMGENIGAAARAMCNFGLTDLRLVSPRDGWPNAHANATSSGAFDHMPEPKVFDSVEDAISDLHYVFATTARPRDMVKPVYSPQDAIELAHEKTSHGQNVGLLFGAERTGLQNAEVSACQAIISFTTNPDFSSLNLAQAVLLLSYEWMKQAEKTASDNLSHGKSRPATQNELQSFLDRLESELDTTRFFREDNLRETMLLNVRNIFTRSDLSEQEIRTLHGIISALRGNKIRK